MSFFSHFWSNARWDILSSYPVMTHVGEVGEDEDGDGGGDPVQLTLHVLEGPGFGYVEDKDNAVRLLIHRDV